MKKYTTNGQNIYLTIGNASRELIAISVTEQDAKLIVARLQTLEDFLNRTTMSINSAAYLAWSEMQLEPDLPVIRTGGTAAGRPDKKPDFVETRSEHDKMLDSLTEREVTEMEDQFLAAHGIL